MSGPRNAFERRLDAQLKRSGACAEYECKKIPYIIECNYIPDWVLKNGIIVEGKGRLDKDEKRKLISIRKSNPGIDLRLVFYDAHKRVAGTKQSHADWAIRNNFKWSHEVCPQEWIDEYP